MKTDLIYENNKVILVYKLENHYAIDIAKIPKKDFDLNLESNCYQYVCWLTEKNESFKWSYLAEKLKFADPPPNVEEIGFITEKELDKYQQICNDLNYAYSKYCDEITDLKKKLYK